VKLNTEIIASKIKKPKNLFLILTHVHKFKVERKGLEEVLDKQMDSNK